MELKKGNPVPPLDRKQFENLFNEWLNERLPISHWNSRARGMFRNEFNRFFDFLQSGVETDKEQPKLPCYSHSGEDHLGA